MTHQFVNKTLRLLSLAVLVFFLCSCNPMIAYSGFTRVDSNRDIRKVGVLPFINNSPRQGAGEIVTSIFMAVIFKSGIFQVEEKGNIERFLANHKIKSFKKISKKEFKKMGEWLNIDAVFMGTVEEFAGGDQGRLSTPVLSIRAKLIDLRTGKVLWMMRHSKRGDDYVKIFELGRVRSVSTLTKRVLTEAIEGMM